MKKTVFKVWLAFICVVLIAGGAALAQTPQKSKNAGQKKGTTGKIVIEFVGFPDMLKQYAVYPWETLNMPEFQNAYAEMLGTGKHEEWVRSLTGTGDQNRILLVSKEFLLLIAICKPHSCDTSQIIVLFNPASKKCWAIYAQGGKFDWFGSPDDKIRNLLKILLAEEYREMYKAQ